MVNGRTAPFDPSLNIENDHTFSKKGSVWRERDTKIEKSVSIKNAAIGSGSVIGNGASIINSVIGRNCHIPPGAVIEDSILWNNVTVSSPDSKIHRCIIGSYVTLPKDTRLGMGNILPPKTSLPANLKLEDNNQTFTVFTSDTQQSHSKSEDSDSDDDFETVPIGEPYNSVD